MIFPFNHIDDNYYIYIIYVAKLIFNRIQYVPVISKNRDYWRMTSFVYGILYRCA